MNWDNGCYRALRPFADELAFFGHSALRVQILMEFFGIHVVGALVDVDELWHRSCLGYGFGRRDEGVRHRYYYIARLHTGRHQRETESVCAAADCYRTFCVAEGGKLFFEVLDHWATYKAAGTNRLLKDRCQFLLEFGVRCDQIKK